MRLLYPEHRLFGSHVCVFPPGCQRGPSHIQAKDLFIARITKIIAKTNKLSRRKKRGWFTKEAMSKQLQWSSILGSKYNQFIGIKNHWCSIRFDV